MEPLAHQCVQVTTVNCQGLGDGSQAFVLDRILELLGMTNLAVPEKQES